MLSHAAQGFPWGTVLDVALFTALLGIGAAVLYWRDELGISTFGGVFVNSGLTPLVLTTWALLLGSSMFRKQNLVKCVIMVPELQRVADSHFAGVRIASRSPATLFDCRAVSSREGATLVPDEMRQALSAGVCFSTGYALLNYVGEVSHDPRAAGIECNAEPRTAGGAV